MVVTHVRMLRYALYVRTYCTAYRITDDLPLERSRKRKNVSAVGRATPSVLLSLAIYDAWSVPRFMGQPY